MFKSLYTTLNTYLNCRGFRKSLPTLKNLGANMVTGRILPERVSKQPLDRIAQLLRDGLKPREKRKMSKTFSLNAWDASAGTATAEVAKMICDFKDFKNRCKETTKAWTLQDSGEFHICPPGLSLSLNSELECENLDDSCSAAMRSLPMTLMHEMTYV
jgi:hypothetical protein